jgi:hypothetical protein
MNVIDGFNVVCEQFTQTAALEMCLRENKPSVIILYEPILEFIRAFELYNAENPDRKIKVYVISFKDSSELTDIYEAID